MIKETKVKNIFVSDTGIVYSDCIKTRWSLRKVPLYKVAITVSKKDGRASITRNKNLYRVHRLVYETFVGEVAKGFVVDHIDRNPSNNNVTNLRLATKSNNASNSRVVKKSTTRFKGVSFDKNRNLYESKITVNYKTIHLGRFSTAEEAAQAYDRAAVMYFKQYAATNEELR
jgi:hypothetical protein